MRERSVEHYFCMAVTAAGGIHRKVQWIARNGAPDRWCGFPATRRTAWVELKGDGGKLSIHQRREIERLRSCGEVVRVIANTDDVDEFVEDMARPL